MLLFPIDWVEPFGHFNGELCRSRFTQASNAVGCSQRRAVAVIVSSRKRESSQADWPDDPAEPGQNLRPVVEIKKTSKC